MVKFGLEGMSDIEMNAWSKHHKQLSIHVKREYLDGGEVVETDDNEILKVIENNEDRILKKRQLLFNHKTHKQREALDYFLVLDNKEYVETQCVEHYSVGASNTSHTTNVRLFFKIDYVDFVLDHTYKTSGSFAMSFYDLIDGNGIEGIVDEIAGSECEFTEKGIEYNESDYGDYYIVGVDEYKRPIEFAISSRELLNSLISVEIYKYDMIIED